MRTAHGHLAVRAVGSVARTAYPPGMKSSTLAGPSPQLSHSRPIAAGVSIGHVHLKVAHLERAITFYRDVAKADIALSEGQQGKITEPVQELVNLLTKSRGTLKSR